MPFVTPFWLKIKQNKNLCICCMSDLMICFGMSMQDFINVGDKMNLVCLSFINSIITFNDLSPLGLEKRE